MQKLFEAAWTGALSRHDRMGRAVAGRRAVGGRCRDQNARRPTSTNTTPPSPTSSRRRRPAASPTLAGVADRTGWCPVDPVTFDSKLQPNIHVIGDAAIAGAMPRSASAAHSQAQICAAAIAALLAGKTPAAPTLTSSCYSLIAPDYAISQKGTYRPVDDQYAEAEGGPVISPQDAPRSARKAEADEADAWFRDHHRRGVRMMRASRCVARRAGALLRAGARAGGACVPTSRRRRHPEIADRPAGRSGARPRHRGQAREHVPALPLRPVPRAALPGRPVAQPERHRRALVGGRVAAAAG